jgi:hypothetical protein
MENTPMNRVFALLAVCFVASLQVSAYSQTLGSPQSVYLRPLKYTNPIPATNSNNSLTVFYETTATVPSTVIFSNKSFKLYAYYQSNNAPVNVTTYNYICTMTSKGNGNGTTTYTFSGKINFATAPLQPGIFLNFFASEANGETWRWPSNNFNVR